MRPAKRKMGCNAKFFSFSVALKLFGDSLNFRLILADHLHNFSETTQ